MTNAALRIGRPSHPLGHRKQELAQGRMVRRGTLKLLPRSPDATRWSGPRANTEPADGAANGELAAYFADVRRHAVMSRDEEHDVAARFVETGDQTLAARLVHANLRLVLKLAFEYRVPRRSLFDLIQEGNLGLVHAVQRYDPFRGIKLATYAVWWIRAYMLKFIISNARLVRIGTTQRQRKVFFGMGRTRARLAGTTGAEVAVGELAAALSVPEQEIEEMERRMSSSEASLDAPAYDGDDRVRLDCVCADSPGAETELENYEANRLLKRELRAFGWGLTGRDRVIFRRRLHCQIPETLASIADEFGVSRERVRQIEHGLKTRLREHLERALGEAIPELCSERGRRASGLALAGCPDPAELVHAASRVSGFSKGHPNRSVCERARHDARTPSASPLARRLCRHLCSRGPLERKRPSVGDLTPSLRSRDDTLSATVLTEVRRGGDLAARRAATSARDGSLGVAKRLG
jgi:RNA polymerase sigma-32 factor